MEVLRRLLIVLSIQHVLGDRVSIPTMTILRPQGVRFTYPGIVIRVGHFSTNPSDARDESNTLLIKNRHIIEYKSRRIGHNIGW